MRSRRLGTREPSPVLGSSQPKISPSFQRSAHSALAARDEFCVGSPAARASTSIGKSSRSPGVGSSHTSSSRKSGVSSWMRQGREVCAEFGSFIRPLRIITYKRACTYLTGRAPRTLAGRAAGVRRARPFAPRLQQPRAGGGGARRRLHARRALPPVQGQGGLGAGGARLGRQELAARG